MAASISRNVGRRGTIMGVTCVGAVSAALGGMYLIGRDVKKKEGQSSPYEHEGHGIGGSDKAMTSSDVNAAVSIPKPGRGKERLPGAVSNKD